MATARKAARKTAPAAPGPRRLGASARSAKEAPSARTLTASTGTVTLEELLVGFQRSLARATRSSLETARADWQVGLGQRSLYVVDSIGVTLAAGVVASVDAAGQVQTVSLDLGQGQGSGGSTIEFRVQARPIEAIAGEQLTLADTDPLGHRRPRHTMRFTLIGAHDGDGAAVARPTRAAPASEPSGQSQGDDRPPAAPTWVPLAGREITVYVVGGDTGKTETFALRTNQVGQIDLEVDAGANRIVSGDRSEAFHELDLLTRDDDFFVYAACSAAQAKGALSGDLTSNVIQFWVARDAAAARAAPARKGGR